MDRKKMNRYNDRIEQLGNEVKENQQEIEITNNQSTIDKLEEDIYNTKQSIKELKKYV
jgi:flagellar biosynthesis chaperone FliJ